MMANLTKGEREVLETAGRFGVVGFGPHAQTVSNLQKWGLLSRDRDPWGYYEITDAGRAALRDSEDGK